VDFHPIMILRIGVPKGCRDPSLGLRMTAEVEGVL
jgi:hypothetical protein